MMFTDHLLALAANVLDACRATDMRMAVAESCTGGLICGCLTAVAGSSDVLDRGYVTYANAAKIDMIGVPEALIAEGGAVSGPVARAMAEGALEHSGADLALAVTGIAGPGGGADDKPVGLVHIAAIRRGKEAVHESHVFPGDREEIRMKTVEAALKLAYCLAIDEDGDSTR